MGRPRNLSPAEVTQEKITLLDEVIAWCLRQAAPLAVAGSNPDRVEALRHVVEYLVAMQAVIK